MQASRSAESQLLGSTASLGTVLPGTENGTVSHHIVPNPSGKYAITANTHPRMYHSASQQHCSTEDSDTAICQFAYTRCPALHLACPHQEHHKCSVDVFKGQLDKFLLTVPDEPQITGYTAQRRAESNSLLGMACHAHTRNRMEVLSGNPSAMKVALSALP